MPKYNHNMVNQKEHLRHMFYLYFFCYKPKNWNNLPFCSLMKQLWEGLKLSSLRIPPTSKNIFFAASKTFLFFLIFLSASATQLITVARNAKNFLNNIHEASYLIFFSRTFGLVSPLAASTWLIFLLDLILMTPFSFFLSGQSAHHASWLSPTLTTLGFFSTVSSAACLILTLSTNP